MTLVALQIRFVRRLLPAALAAGTAFNINPNVLLAQAALESGWAQSDLALQANNLFALSAYGCSNNYWHGGKITLAATGYALDFRRYDTPQNSFMDFARLVRCCYPTAWMASAHPAAYAKEIAYSAYLGGDDADLANRSDREIYRHSLTHAYHTIRAIEEMLTADPATDTITL